MNFLRNFVFFGPPKIGILDPGQKIPAHSGVHDSHKPFSGCICNMGGYLKQKINKIKNKAKLEKRIAETKLQALQSQMNPHFVFNAMNSIQNFVIDNQTDEALSYIGEFSKLIRQTLNFSSRTTIRLEEEITYLKRYIELENLRTLTVTNVPADV